MRCYARRLGDSRRNAHAKAQAALEPGLRQTSHAIVWPLRPPFLSFSLPPSLRQRCAGSAVVHGQPFHGVTCVLHAGACASGPWANFEFHVHFGFFEVAAIFLHQSVVLDLLNPNPFVGKRQRCPKVVFSSLFFSHRITVKPLPRQLDLAAASCHFPAQTNTLQRVRHFFFYLRRRRFKPILGSRDFLYFFPVFVFSLRLFIYLFIYLFFCFIDLIFVLYLLAIRSSF